MPRAKVKASNCKAEEKGEIAVRSSTRVVRGDNFQSLYINNARFGVTRFDIQMVLGENAISHSPEHTDTITELLNLKMTPPYAKTFAIELTKFIQAYERQYGEIQLPPELKSGILSLE
jgi:hypothetical protein